MARMFGTDGVRGVAGSELTIELAMKLGQAGAYVLTKEQDTIDEYMPDLRRFLHWQSDRRSNNRRTKIPHRL